MPTPSEIQSRFGSTAPLSHSDGTGIRTLPVEAECPNGTFMSSDGTGIRTLPVEAECPNGRHSVKAGVLLLRTPTRTQLVTVNVFA
ncbi:unnamed protein product [Phytophthora fragariaefolia]|uniref:Unnamed protein product n=1 Tax=Phytophthora fragariaefolia TaxID=1490495 RepID=A0A9W7DCF1_9STRA|nr:unnamed protein product [Phytophthora fragariaefolia]